MKLKPWPRLFATLLFLPPVAVSASPDAAGAPAASVGESRPSVQPRGEPLVLVFADEFDGDTLDSSLWQSQAYEDGIKHGVARGPGNVDVSGGNLRLHIRREDRTFTVKGQPVRAKWTAGYLFTKRDFGPDTYFEARIRSGQAPRVNNAFWLGARNKSGNATRRDHVSNRYEVDIVEAQYVPGGLPGKDGNGHTAWHDWKTYGYAKDKNGRLCDIALGMWTPHSFADYHVWGFWLGESEQIYYLDGKEIWRGQKHRTHHDQWKTGVGKCPLWNPAFEKPAYGRHGQTDWNYRCGYNGDILRVIFSNLPFGDDEGFDPVRDFGQEKQDSHAASLAETSPDGTHMDIDYVRVFKPSRLLAAKPSQKTTLGAGEAPLRLPARAREKIPLSNPVSLDDPAPSFFSAVVKKSAGAAPRLTFLDAAGKPVASAGVTPGNALSCGLLDASTTPRIAWPAKERKEPFFVDDRDYLIVVRITPKTTDDNPSVSVSAYSLDSLPPREAEPPYFYPNITALGSTNLTNGWHLNQKQSAAGRAVAVQIENASADGEVVARVFRAGTSFRSVLH